MTRYPNTRLLSVFIFCHQSFDIKNVLFMYTFFGLSKHLYLLGTCFSRRKKPFYRHLLRYVFILYYIKGIWGLVFTDYIWGQQVQKQGMPVMCPYCLWHLQSGASEGRSNPIYSYKAFRIIAFSSVLVETMVCFRASSSRLMLATKS